MTDSIIKTATVPLSPERAFRLFTEEISDWWPLDTYSLSAEDENVAKSVNITPKVGGDVTETRHDGSTALWGRVTAWEPGKRFGMSWHLGYPDTEITEVEVSFDVIADGTRVTLVHSGWQDLGKAAVAMRKGYEAGWQGLFALRYGAACEARFRRGLIVV